MSSSVVPDGVAGEPPRLKSSEGTREEPEAEDNNAGQDPLLQESAPIRNETLAFDCDALKRTHERDVSFKKRLREKFVGRQAEKDAVLRCYESSASEERMSLLLVTGPTGVGKTTLITKTLKDPVERQGGFLLTGKFDQLQHRIPHKAFVSILSELAFQVRDRGKSNVQETQTALQQALTNEEASLLTELIPELEGLVGDHIVEPVCKSKAELSPNRFIFVLKKLLRAICSPNRPLILVFEDIHWADPHWATNLMRLVTDCAMEGLFLVGTFDDSAVTDDSYLSQKLRDMEKNEQVAITRVNVGSLNKEEILEWICELFPILGAEQRESFARSVKDHSEGNHCRIVQYVDWLEGSGFLKFEDKSDSFELEKEQVRISPDFDFLADKIERLSIETREVVKFAACLGYSVDDELIEAVVGYPVDGYLAEAAKEDVLVMNDRRGVYAFMHDSMHDAVLRLIPENEREHFHAEVGRQMWRNLDNEDFDRNIFLFLSQMNLGKRFLRRDTEKHAVASFCLQAGKKAARYSTFRTAAFYLRLGTDLLSDRSWDDEYDLTLALHSAAAEIEMCTANFERMDELVEKTLTKAKAPRDKIPVYGTRMSAMSVNDRQLEALRLGMDGLRILGERFPRKSHTANSLLELIRVKRLLRGKSNEQLLKLPLMEDEDKLTCMQILQLMFLPAALHDPMIFALVILRTVKLTLRHGLSAISSFAFATYGLLEISVNGNVEEANRYGVLGLQLLDKFNAIEYLPRVYMAFYGCILPWKKPIRGALEPLLQAYRVGIQTGDKEFASLSFFTYCYLAMESGMPIDKIDKEWTAAQGTMTSNRQLSLLRQAIAHKQALHHYMGLSDPLISKGDLMDWDEEIRLAKEKGNENTHQIVHSLRMNVAYIFNDYELANSLAMVVVKGIEKMPATFEQINALFFSSMVALAMAAKGKQYRRNVRWTKKTIKKFKRYARHCPDNFLEKLYLLEAELARVRGHNEKARDKYKSAIAYAANSGFLFMHALANERAARFFVARDDLANAELYFREACLSYKTWGGTGKLERLEGELEAIRE